MSVHFKDILQVQYYSVRLVKLCSTVILHIVARHVSDY